MSLNSYKAKVKKLIAALEEAVWRDRPEFPGDPYCVLCGAGRNWAKKYGHQRNCALAKETDDRL
jgi:hypothetical protein